jgi:D-alanine--poly(phosphoribitol) ligase subunit 1
VSRDAETELENPSVLQAIIDRSRLEPGHPAAKDLDRELTYAELIKEVTQVAAGLSAQEVTKGDRVGLLMPNSVDFIVAALACLWIGAIFVPLAVTDPQSRLETVVADCTPTLVVGPSTFDAAPLTDLGETSLVSIDLLRQIAPMPVDQIDDPDGVAYMIYTSGTTGTPKGVQIGNIAFAAAVQSTAAALGLDVSTRTLCVSPFHFDGSYANLFPTLVSGGTVVIRPREALLYPRTFFHAVAQERITYAGFTPSYLRLLLASRQITDLSGSTLEVIALGGEATSVAELRSLWSIAPALRIFNRYGPTESTIAVTNVELTPKSIDGGTVTIGRPHPGVFFVIVDEAGQVVENANQTGELYIAGIQLMSGYWGDPRLTSDVIRNDIIPGQALYRTGDLVYRDELDNYIYVDRADRVVKRNGVRISLVELSEQMTKVDGVGSAACLIFDLEGELGVVAFVSTDSELSATDLRRAARAFIPENMLPDRIEQITTLPLNRSNQLDEDLLLSTANLRPYRQARNNPSTAD